MDKKYLFFFATLLFGFILLLQSCATTKRNLVYFSNLPDSTIYDEAINNKLEPKIQEGDALSVIVTTLNPDANVLLNSGALPLNNQYFATSSSNGNASTPSADGYIVDENGEIYFPQLGKVKVEGLTKLQAQEVITKGLNEIVKEPIVNIRILNFKVSVLGEVTHSGSFIIPNGKINVLEALSMAGDMTPYAIRNNVLVIREQNGRRIVKHINFNDKELLNSPFYNLQQNDIVYVQPENRLKAAQANNGDFRLWSIILSGMSVVAIVLSRVL